MLLLLLNRAGEIFVFIFAVVVAISIPIAIIVGVWWVVRRNQLNRAAWQKLAGEIRFHMPNPQKLEMLGKYNGIDTRLAVGARRRGSGDERHVEHFTYCTSKFPKPLRFAVKISSQKGWLSNLLKSSRDTIGERSFDENFGVKCYDKRRIRRLLLSDFPSHKTANLMGDLMLASQNYDVITLTDNHVYIETSGHIRDHDDLKKLLQITNGVARRFAEARKLFPLEEWEKQLVGNWTAFASNNGLEFDQEDFRLKGVYRGFPFESWVHPEPGKWKTSIEVRFPQKLMVGFKIYPEIGLHSAVKLFGFQDIETGHKAFDDAFIVKAKK